MSALHEYKCPNCDGHLQFDSGTQKMKCPYCDTDFEISVLEEFDNARKDEKVKSDNFSWDDKNDASVDSTEFNSYLCNTCSGEIITDKTTAATSCPYCGNPVIMQPQFSGILKPDYVIPFKLNKDKAIETYKNHIKGKKLLPDVFKEKNHIDEIKGIYVPVWLFDANIQGNARYKATIVRHWRDSDFNYTETRHFSVFRGGNMAFAKIPVDGSSKMDDDLMESIEPFNFSDAVDFQTAYLSGYFADKYDVDANTSIVRANERIKKSMVDSLSSTVSGYSSIVPIDNSVNMLSGTHKYALYPVWLLNTSWNGQKFTFAMNGQTGKFVGNLPYDKNKLLKHFAISSVAGTAVVFAATLLYNLLLG